MNLQDSPLFVDLLKKLVTEAKRAKTDASASVGTSPIKELLTSLEKLDFSNLDLGKLLGILLPQGSNSGLGGMLGALTQAIGIGGPSAEETKAAYDSAMKDASAVGRDLAALNTADLSPERSRLVGILGKAFDFIKANA